MFAALVSVVLYGVYVFVQTVRHRSLTVGLGSAMVLGGVVHLVIFAAFLFVAVIP